MMTIQTTRIAIERVERIEARNTEDYTDQLAFAKREVIVWTEDGQRYEFFLVADTPEQLDLIDPAAEAEAKLRELGETKLREWEDE